MPYMETIDSNKWRWDKYICEDVDLVLKSYKRILDGIYDKYSGRYTKPGAKNFMSLEEFEDICMDGGFINETLVQREIDISFNLAMMTQVDELNQNRHAEMTWVEFIEALSRVADQANVPTPKAGEDNQVDVNENAANLPLAQKLENMMPKLLQLCSAHLQENFNFPSTSPFYGIKKAIKRTSVSSVILSPKSSTDLEGPQGLNMTRSSQKDKGSTLGSVAGSPRKSIIEEQASIPFIQGMNPSVS